MINSKNKSMSLTKFAIVAMFMGFFSPSITVEKSSTTTNSLTSYMPTSISVSLLNSAEARRGGGARRSGGRSGSRNRNRNVNRNSNRNVNRNSNRNRNVNRNVNVNVNRGYHGGGHHHGRHSGFHRGGGYYYRGSYHPVARFTFAMLTAVAVGTIISSASMSSTCKTIRVNNINYKRCDNTWFEPFYEGGDLQYKAVSNP